jgi:dienelactone hydrolase
MKHARLTALGHLLLSLLLALPAPAAAGPQAPDAISVRADAIVDLLASGRFDDVVATFDEKLRGALPAPKLEATWRAIEQQAGAFERRVASRSTLNRTGIVTCAFARARLDVQLSFNADGAVVGLFFRPAAAPPVASALPSYARPDAYTEHDVVTGAADWPLPGTLTMPVGEGPFAAVVLVHGSGPQDRDVSVGPNKVFRDLALGLASNGVAVLRYEKRSRQHAPRMASTAGMTVKDEVTDDALAGVALLRRTARVDPTRVFVLGHSLGGTLAPRVAETDPSLAGVIVMAGAVKSIEQAVVEQTRYLIAADGQLTDAEREQLMGAERLAARIRALTAADAGSVELLLGAPPSYWLDLRGYDPPATASRLTHPFLVLQGERDYQVTMADFARWRAALESRANVTLRSYPALNHLFMRGSGPSLPEEYLTPAHVDADVVTHIAAWMASVPRRP